MRQRIIYPALTVLFLLGFLELASFAFLSLLNGRSVSWGFLQEQRQGLALQGSPLPQGEPHADPEVEPDWLAHRIAMPPALHPYLGFVADPETHRAAKDPRFDRQAVDYGFPLNRQALFQPRDPNRRVVGIFGGSFAVDLSLARKAVEQELARLPDFRGREIVILNLAIGGHKQPQALMTLNYFLALGAHFDLVLLVDGFNEIALPPVTHIPLGYSPFYPRGWPLMVSSMDLPRRKLSGKITYLRERQREIATQGARGPWRFSFAAGAIEKLRQVDLERRIREASSQIQSQPQSASATYQARGPVFEVPRGKDELYGVLVDLWSRSSLQMHQLCRGLDIRFAHFLQPNQYLPESKPLSAEERRTSWDPEHAYRIPVETAYPKLIEAGRGLREGGVDFFDLSQVFEARSETLYRDTCCHINLRGRKLVAQAIADALTGADQEIGKSEVGRRSKAGARERRSHPARQNRRPPARPRGGGSG